MDNPAQPSFIPRKPMTPAGVHGGGSWLGVLLFLVASLVLIASIVAAGGAFLYERFVKNSIATKSETLRQTEAAFDPATIQELVHLDSQINNAQALLQKHTTALGVFNFLSQDTLQTVQFSSLGYDLSEAGVAQISLMGMADSFATVALQSDRFGSNKLLKEVAFSGISINPDGHIVFTVKATIDPNLINYAKNLTAQAAIPPPGVLPATQRNTGNPIPSPHTP